jgi:spore coat protein A, manganese oxidase
MRIRFAEFTRREFLKNSGLVMAGLAVGQSNPHRTGVLGRPLLDVSSLEKFVDALPIPAVAKPREMRWSPEDSSKKIPYYRVAMTQIENRFHRDMKPTRMWGFGGSSPGPTFETRSGEGLLVEWPNDLPAKHFLPIDHKVHGADADKPEVRTVVHLHGGKTPAKSDGYPEDWYPTGKSALYHYPNGQDATMLWYHDHALGITRLGNYAGLFGAYFVRDEFEDGLNLPKGKYEIPLILCDRTFDRESQLFYPVSPDPDSPWVPEVFGDVIAVNGKVFPHLEVEPRKYRFRILNAANGRFFHLAMSNGQEFHQIGTDLGLLPAPVPLKDLVIAPAERADLVVDFSDHAGEKITVTSDILTVMQIRVSKNRVEDPSSLSKTLRPVRRIPEMEAVQHRVLTLGEKDDRAGNPEMMLLNNAHWSMPITENPKLNSTEIWSFLNFTDDSHPIHLHLVRFQILDRRKFEPYYYYTAGQVKYIGPSVAPAPNEMGWKDTVQAHPGMVTRIIARFDGYPGRYVWHCHILEHEDNEMMRPYDVIAG